MIHPPTPPIYTGPEDDEAPDGTSRDFKKAIVWGVKNPDMEFDQRIESIYALRQEYAWRRRIDREIRSIVDDAPSPMHRDSLALFYAEIDDTREIPLLRAAYLAWYVVSFSCWCTALPGTLVLLAAAFLPDVPLWLGLAGLVWAFLWGTVATSLRSVSRRRWQEIQNRYQQGVDRSKAFLDAHGTDPAFGSPDPQPLAATDGEDE